MCWSAVGADRCYPPNGEEACENQGFDEFMCAERGCCEWNNGMCWSAVGQDVCEGAENFEFVDEQGFRCADWAGWDCLSSAINLGYSPEGQEELLQNCAETCGSYVEPTTTEAPMFGFGVNHGAQGTTTTQTPGVTDESPSQESPTQDGGSS